VDTEETAAADVSFLHTSHCLASGQVMISALADKNGQPKGKTASMDESISQSEVFNVARIRIAVNAAGVTGVMTPQYLTCRGPSMCWTRPIITPTQSRIQRTIVVNCVVGAVEEQFYSCPVRADHGTLHNSTTIYSSMSSTPLQ